jgi:hypothetical protein
MKLDIGSVTYNDWEYNLIVELRKIIEKKVNDNFSFLNFEIAYIARFLKPDYEKKPVIRYTKNDSCLLIDIKINSDEFINMYKIEKRFHLGIIFLEWLEKGLENKSFLKENPTFNKDEFIQYIIKLGRENGWFLDEVDYSQDLDY